MCIIKQGYDLHLILNLENAAMTNKTSHYEHQILGECLIEYSYLITSRVGGGGGVSLTNHVKPSSTVETWFKYSFLRVSFSAANFSPCRRHT